MPVVNIVSWNIQTYGTKKQTSTSTFLQQMIASLLKGAQIHILVILELQNNASTSILTQICGLLGTGWLFHSIDVGDESVGFLWNSAVVQAVAGQRPNTFVADIVTTGFNNQPLSFPKTGTPWKSLASTRPKGRVPAFMLFRTPGTTGTSFLVAGLHAPFNTSTSIQSYSAHQYGLAREATKVSLNNVSQQDAALAASSKNVAAAILALLAAAGLATGGQAQWQVARLTNRFLFQTLILQPIQDKLVTYDPAVFPAMLENLMSTVSLTSWPKAITGDNARIFLLQSIATVAYCLSELWPMPAGTALTYLKSWAAVDFSKFVVNASSKLNAVAWSMLSSIVTPNPFAGIGTVLQIVPVSYCVFAGDFNVPAPDGTVYDAAQQQLLGVPATPAGNAYTALSNAPDATLKRQVLFSANPTTCVSTFTLGYRYTFNQAQYNTLYAGANTPTLKKLCVALLSVSTTSFCGYSAFYSGILAALLGQGLTRADLETYAAQINLVFPSVDFYNNTAQMRYSSFDNFSIQYPANIGNPAVGDMPDLLSMLGNWTQQVTVPCTWSAALAGLNSIARNYLIANPLTVAGVKLSPNLTEVNDATAFYRRKISDHFPIRVALTLP